MSHPTKPDPVKLMASLFSAEKSLIEDTVNRLVEVFGPLDWMSPELVFDRTRYYEKEMGWPLHRRFITFEKLISPEHIVHVKLSTNQLEQASVKDGNRSINIDPGYVALERLILATGKNYVHRVYLDKGIYADLTLVYKKNGFQSLPWTYPDYADEKTIGFFNEIRKNYLDQLRASRMIDNAI